MTIMEKADLITCLTSKYQESEIDAEALINNIRILLSSGEVPLTAVDESVAIAIVEDQMGIDHQSTDDEVHLMIPDDASHRDLWGV